MNYRELLEKRNKLHNEIDVLNTCRTIPMKYEQSQKLNETIKRKQFEYKVILSKMKGFKNNEKNKTI